MMAMVAIAAIIVQVQLVVQYVVGVQGVFLLGGRGRHEAVIRDQLQRVVVRALMLRHLIHQSTVVARELLLALRRPWICRVESRVSRQIALIQAHQVRHDSCLIAEH